MYFGIGSVTRLSPIHRVAQRQERDVPHEPEVGLDVDPPGFSERRHRLNECLPTASKTTSYVLPFLVKSSCV